MYKLLVKGDKNSSNLRNLINDVIASHPEVSIEVVGELPDGSSPAALYNDLSLYTPPMDYEFIKKPLYQAEPIKSGKERRRERRALERKSMKSHAKKINPIG